MQKLDWKVCAVANGFLLRIKYVKRGPLAFLSHLETVRSIERIIRRANFPYAISEGFNPHMKIAFGAALPVGAASRGEYVDVRLTEYIAPEKALAALQAQSVEQLMPIECFYINSQDLAASVAFPLSVWRAEIHGSTLCEVKDAMEKLLQKGSIEVIRKNKKPKTVEFEGRLVEGPELVDKVDFVEINFSTLAREDGSLRPDKFLQAALEEISGAEFTNLERIEQKQV